MTQSVLLTSYAREACVFQTLKQVVKENWQWRKQAWNLAKLELVKTYRGAALGWVWLFVKPAVYIAVYWFTISVGLRSGNDVNGQPFLLWLACGVFPWFFMSDAINKGSDVYREYSYLVKRIRFPLSVISSFYMLSKMIVLVGTMAFVILFCIIFQVELTIYLIQLPLVFLIMYLFWTAWSMMLSPLSALSKDFAKLIQTLSMPFFWLSGILFQLSSLPEALQVVMAFNPVAWCVEAVRDCFIYQEWFFLDLEEFIPFLIVFAIVVALAMHNYRKLHNEVADVL